MDLHDQIQEMGRAAGISPPYSSDITVAAYLTDWLVLRELTLRPSTWVGYERSLRLYVIPHVGAMRLSEVTVAVVEQLLSVLLERGGQFGQPLARATVRGIRGVMYTAFQDAVRNGHLYVNSVSRARLPRFREIEPLPPPIWSADELRRFLEYVSEHPLGRLIKLTSLTGLRRGEVLGLQWRHIDFDEGTLVVAQQLAQEPDGRRVLRAPKSFARSIAIGRQAMGALRAERKIQNENRLGVPVWYGGDHDLVFTMRNGKPLNMDKVTSAFRHLVDAAGVPGIEFKHLRHTHASLLLLAGVPVSVVSQRLGHSDQWTTLSRYAFSLPAAEAQAANLFEDLVRVADDRIRRGRGQPSRLTWASTLPAVIGRETGRR